MIAKKRKLPISKSSSVGCLTSIGSGFKTFSGKKERKAVQKVGSK